MVLTRVSTQRLIQRGGDAMECCTVVPLRNGFLARGDVPFTHISGAFSLQPAAPAEEPEDAPEGPGPEACHARSGQCAHGARRFPRPRGQGRSYREGGRIQPRRRPAETHPAARYVPRSVEAAEAIARGSAANGASGPSAFFRRRASRSLLRRRRLQGRGPTCPSPPVCTCLAQRLPRGTFRRLSSV
jgi:hypothetical protein